MSDKLQFIRRYAKRETSKRSFQIVRTWATPKESDSEQFSGPSRTERKIPEASNSATDLTTEIDSSDSSDLTYQPPESQITGPESTSETPAIPETEIGTTEPEYSSQSPGDNQETTETPYSAEQDEDARRSTATSRESSAESSPSSKIQKETNATETEQTTSEFPSVEQPEARDESGGAKWTVKNWVDVDVTEEIQKLSQVIQSEETPEPQSSSSEAKIDEQSGDEYSGSEASLEPPASVCEQEFEALDPSSVPDDRMVDGSPLPIGEPSLELAVSESPSVASVISNSSMTPTKTLSVRLERMDMEKYRLSGESNGAKYSDDRSTMKVKRNSGDSVKVTGKEEVEAEDRITSSIHGNRNPKKVLRGPKSVRRKFKGQKSPDEVSDADSSEVSSGRVTPSGGEKPVAYESHKESDASGWSSKSPQSVKSAGSKKRPQGKETDTSSPDESDVSVRTDNSPEKKRKTQETPSHKSKSKKVKQKSRKAAQTSPESSPQEAVPGDQSGATRRTSRDVDVSVTPQVKNQSKSDVSSTRKVKASEDASVTNKLQTASGGSDSDQKGRSGKKLKRTGTSKDPKPKSPTATNSGKGKPNTKTQSRKTSRKSRTSSDLSTAQEEEDVDTERSQLQTTDREDQGTSVMHEPIEDNNEDSVSVGSSLRLEVVVDLEGSRAEKMKSLSSSSWMGKKISASKKPGGGSSRRFDQTSSRGSDDTLGFVTSAPSTKKKLTKKAPARKKDLISKDTSKGVTPTGSKPRGRRVVSSDDADHSQGLSVSVWTGPSQPRRGTDVLDLDIVLECLKGVESEMYEEAECRPSERATQRVSTFVRREVHKTICQVQEIKHRQSQVKKTCSRVKSLRTELKEKQHNKMKLNSRLKKLRSTSGIDEDLINLNSWLDDYDKLIQAWDKSKAAQSKPQKYKWFGDVPEEMKTIC